jgi:hypothetical protein
MNAGAMREAKADPFATSEAKIAELRKQRTAKLAVVRYDFIDALIAAYDDALAHNETLKSELDTANAELEFIKTGSTDVHSTEA